MTISEIISVIIFFMGILFFIFPFIVEIFSTTYKNYKNGSLEFFDLIWIVIAILSIVAVVMEISFIFK